MSSNFTQMGQPTTEFASNNDRHKRLNGLYFARNQTADIGVTWH